VTFVLAGSLSAWASKYSPGPYTTYDINGTQFTSRHYIVYDWLGASGLYTYSSQLYVNITSSGGVLDCMQEKAEYGASNPTYYRTSAYPLPRYYSSPGMWISRPWNATHGWVGGQYVKYINEIADEILYDDYPTCGWTAVPGMGGWSSAVDTSQQWLHIHLTH